MKTTGIARGVDKLGRVVIPIELRRSLDITEKDSLEIYVEKDRIVLKKHTDSCVFCDSTNNITFHKNKLICEACKRDIKGGL